MTKPISPSFWSHAWEQADLAVHAITALFFSVLEGWFPRVGDKLHAAWGHITTLHARIVGKWKLAASEAKIQELAQENLRLNEELQIQTGLLEETRIRSQDNLSAQAVQIARLEERLSSFSLQQSEITRLQNERDAQIAEVENERNKAEGLQRQLTALKNSMDEWKEQYRQRQQQPMNTELWQRLLASSERLTQMMQYQATSDVILEQYQNQAADWHQALRDQIQILSISPPLAHILQSILQLSEEAMQRLIQLASLYQTTQNLEDFIYGVKPC